MKRDETPLLTAQRLTEARDIGAKLARLRVARRLRQEDVARRAGMSRSTAVLIEQGDIRRTQAQLLRYLDAIAPGLAYVDFLLEKDPALIALASREATQRVRPMSESELKKLDF
ncbi:helix-turn-helix domain-containing protein [Bordetella sp. FB-8]|uniref:helix-turn-helix domain-containing protein n=1 Tax=Bordetella sp. FB-8 TaxID=1159870 RepID=UPI00037FB958|nr:helix-turn-helix domain-containing protein [Bordetella sp. FB-8]